MIEKIIQKRLWMVHINQETSGYGEISYLIPYDGAMDRNLKSKWYIIRVLKP